jgi:hypothetical protein
MTTVVNNEKVSTISKTDDITTLINVFTVEPENQQRLVELLVESTEEFWSKLPGFISSNVHKSLDGTHVVNYVQWKKGSIESIEKSREIVKERGGERYQYWYNEILKIANFKPLLYEICYINKQECL